MIRNVVQPPSLAKRYVNAGNFSGVNVVGGDHYTGKLPTAIGSGIFGAGENNDECEGIFSPEVPRKMSGIFFDPYASDSIGQAQPDDAWVMLRRPGQPLYPGSSGYGIVLVGPSMGNGETTPATVANPLSTSSIAIYLALGGAIGWLLYKITQSEGV